MGDSTLGLLPKGGGIPVRFRQAPYPSINDCSESTDIAAWGDLVKDRLLVFTPPGEHFSGNLIGSKLDDVTQRDVLNREVNKTRYIPGRRLEENSRIPNFRHPRCVAPRHANVPRRILYWWILYPATLFRFPKGMLKAHLR